MKFIPYYSQAWWLTVVAAKPADQQRRGNMHYLLILVTMLSLEGAKVEVLSYHRTISDCHVAMTQKRFEYKAPRNEDLFCIHTKPEWAPK